MLNIFQIKNNQLCRINENNKTYPFLNNIIWIDIVQSHDDYENQHIQTIFKKNKIVFFNLKNIKKNERFFNNENELYIRSYFFSYKNTKNKINNSTVYFIIHNNCLYTIRKEKLLAFYIYKKKSENNHYVIHNNPYELLFSLFEIKINQLIDEIEKIYNKLEILSLLTIKEQTIDVYNHTISNLTILENIGWKIRINLLDTERTINFLLNNITLPLIQKKHAKKILQDIKSTSPHNEYIFHKVNLLIQTIMGFIAIKQNKIIKIFSIIFLPPTLIASSYGMNFEFMPELHWPFGYPSAIILMILTGLAPYIYFKYKNWL